jgi:hypothetical protein
MEWVMGREEAKPVQVVAVILAPSEVGLGVRKVRIGRPRRRHWKSQSRWKCEMSSEVDPAGVMM